MLSNPCNIGDKHPEVDSEENSCESNTVSRRAYLNLFYSRIISTYANRYIGRMGQQKKAMIQSKLRLDDAASGSCLPQ
jgi:hypothetical protein